MTSRLIDEIKYNQLHVYLVDDHQLFRSGLQFLLSNLQDGIVFEEANNYEAVINYPHKDKIDLILLDYYLPGIEGFDALKTIKKHYNCAVVVLSSEDNPHIIRDAINQGASGFIPKSSSPAVLVAALQLVLANGIYLPPHVLDFPHSNLTIDPRFNKNEIKKQLTKKQLVVLLKAAQGKSNKVIARELNIADGTVKAHLSACYKVLGVDNRTEAVFATVSMGLLAENNTKSEQLENQNCKNGDD